VPVDISFLVAHLRHIYAYNLVALIRPFRLSIIQPPWCVWIEECAITAASNVPSIGKRLTHESPLRTNGTAIEARAAATSL